MGTFLMSPHGDIIKVARHPNLAFHNPSNTLRQQGDIGLGAREHAFGSSAKRRDNKPRFAMIEQENPGTLGCATANLVGAGLAVKGPSGSAALITAISGFRVSTERSRESPVTSDATTEKPGCFAKASDNKIG